MPNEKTKSGQSGHLLQRCAEACGHDNPLEFAHAIGVTWDELLPLWKGSRGQLIAVDQDPVFVALAEYVDNRLGLLMSVREELQRKLTQDRLARAQQRKRTLER